MEALEEILFKAIDFCVVYADLKYKPYVIEFIRWLRDLFILWKDAAAFAIVDEKYRHQIVEKLRNKCKTS